MVATPLLHPDEFFRDRVATNAFLPAAGIVVGSWLVAGLTGVLFLEVIFPVLWEEFATDPEFADLYPTETAADPMGGYEELPGVFGEAWFWYATSVVTMVIFGLGLWLAVTLLLYLVSEVFDGAGSFGQLLRFVGWGFLPVFLLLLVSLGELLFIIVVLGPEAYLDTWTPTELAAPYLTWGIALWVGYIWVYALTNARQLLVKDAIVTAAVPIGGYLLVELSFWFL